MATGGYGFGRSIDRPFETVVDDVRAALAGQGFGVVTEIDLRRTLKEKLDLDRSPYVILGACNPGYAAEVLDTEPELGLFLPCNVIVYEHGGKTRVSIVDPSAMLEMAGTAGIGEIATQVRDKLQAALEAI